MKTVVITGGTGSLGTVVVERLSRSYRCIVLYRSKPPSEVEGVRADLDDEASVRDAFEQIGEHYALVHLAGAFATGAVAETPTETWSNMLAVNVTSAFVAARESLARMTRPGRIVAVSSIAAIEQRGGVAAYVVSKSALNTLVALIAKENAGVCANVVAPDTLTPALKERVAETIEFLLSEAAENISGAVIPLRFAS